MSDIKRDRVLRELRRLQDKILKKTNMKRSGKAAKLAKQFAKQSEKRRKVLEWLDSELKWI